jgi:hypothetical protein
MGDVAHRRGKPQEPIAEGAPTFERLERERIAANRAQGDASPRKVLTAEERAEIAAANAGYVSLMTRVPAHGRPGWSALAPVSRRPSADEAAS